jgi:TonB family protein
MFDKKMIWGLIAFLLVVLCGGVYVLYTFLSDPAPRKRSSVATVNLLKPPPAALKEKPQERKPPPESRQKEEKKEEKKQEKVDQAKEEISDQKEEEPEESKPSNEHRTESNPPQMADNPPQTSADRGPAGEAAGSSDPTPAGDRLGLDTTGVAGSDEFGLVARKGGRSVLSGGVGSGRSGGGGSGKTGGSEPVKIKASESAKRSEAGPIKLGGGGPAKSAGVGQERSPLDEFSWYTQIVKTEVSKKVQKHLEEIRDVPRGKFQTVVRISVDGTGAIVQCGIIGSSGNQEMDEAVKQTLGGVKISEPPPNGMPRTMIIRVTSQS